MQKMVVVKGNDSRELNKYFEEGWRLVNMVAARPNEYDTCTCYCYVVIEKDET